MDDWSAKEKKLLNEMLKADLEARQRTSGTCLQKLQKALMPWLARAQVKRHFVPMR